MNGKELKITYIFLTLYFLIKYVTLHSFSLGCSFILQQMVQVVQTVLEYHNEQNNWSVWTVCCEHMNM